MKMIFILLIWFFLTGNTEMLLLMEQIHPSKGKSKHLDKRRSLFQNPQFPSHNWSMKKSRLKQNTSRRNDEIRMPYRTFKRGNKYKLLKFKPVKRPKFLYPKEIFQPVFKSRVRASLNKLFHYKDLIKKDNNSTSLLRHFGKKNMKTRNFIARNKANLHRDTINKLPFKKMNIEGNFNENGVHLNERSLYTSTFSSVKISRFRSNNFKENFQRSSTAYNKSVYLTGFPKSLSFHRVISKPKYLPLPRSLQFANEKPFQEFSTTMRKIKRISKVSPERRILPKTELPEDSFLFSYSTGANFLELPADYQTMIPKQYFPRSLPRTPVAGRVISRPKYLTLPPFLRLGEFKPHRKLPNSIKQTSFFTYNAPSKSTILLQNVQFATKSPFLDSTVSHSLGSIAYIQNNKSEKENLFEEKSESVIPYLETFSETKKEVSFGNYEIPAVGKQSATVQGQKMTIHKSLSRNMPSHKTTAKMRNQYNKVLKPYSRRSTTSNVMFTTEISSLRYLHNKLKQIKNSHDRLGRKTKILIWSVTAILVTAIFFLIFISAYRHYKYKMKRRYPFKKKHAFTLLRATRQEQKDLLETILKLRGKKKMEEDFED